jgi:hypothetical protein
LSAGGIEIFDAAQAEERKEASATVEEMSDTWDGDKEREVPPLLEALMDDLLDDLAAAVKGSDHAETRQTAINVVRASLDLQLQHRTAAETDLDLLDLWARQLVVDSEAGDRDGMIGDAATLRWIRDRIAREVSPAELRIIDARIADLRRAAEAGDPRRAATAAASFRSTLTRTDLVKSRP